MSQRKKTVKRLSKSMPKRLSKSVSSAKKPSRRKALPPKSRVAGVAMPLLLKLDALDRKLLQLTQGPYSKILKGFHAGRKKLDEERRLAIMVSERILKKAREVRRSLKRSVRI